MQKIVSWTPQAPLFIPQQHLWVMQLTFWIPTKPLDQSYLSICQIDQPPHFVVKKIEYYWLVKLAHFGITHYHYYFLSKINYKLKTVSCKQSSQYMLIILSLGGREGLLTLNKNFILKQIIICMLETCINSLIFRWFPFQNVFAIHLTKALKVNEH